MYASKGLGRGGKNVERNVVMEDNSEEQNKETTATTKQKIH